MTQKQYISEAWESYRRLVVPKNAHETQVSETQKAFYGGAAVLFTLLLRGFSEGDEETPEDFQLMADVQAEIDAFGQQLDRDFFNIRGH